MAQVKLESCAKIFSGFQKVYSHQSKILDCKMRFSLFVPPIASSQHKVPVLYWLSGLTCTEENFILKSGFQGYAAKHNICVVGPDTSPRGCNIEGEDDSFDFGTGAGFYVDSTQEKWKKHYNMYSYITKELIQVVEESFDFIKSGVRSISGHSMGGHGALICALKNPGFYRCATAFAPISNPIKSKWGRKAFTGYLGTDEEKWKEYDATHLVTKYKGPSLHLKIDQGSDDPYLKEELFVQNFIDACIASNIKVDYNIHEGYEHGYYFVATYIGEHIQHHSNILKD